MSKELLKCNNDIIAFVFRENLVNKELLVPLGTVDLLDLWDPLDLLDLLESLEERSELHNNNNSNKMFQNIRTSVVYHFYVWGNQKDTISSSKNMFLYLRVPLDQMDLLVEMELLESR